MDTLSSAHPTCTHSPALCCSEGASVHGSPARDRTWPWFSKFGSFKHFTLHITLWWWTGTNSQSSTSRALTWIQGKLGKHYLLKKFTLPWESNPGPTPIRGDPATLVASVGSNWKIPVLYELLRGTLGKPPQPLAILEQRPLLLDLDRV